MRDVVKGVLYQTSSLWPCMDVLGHTLTMVKLGYEQVAL